MKKTLLLCFFTGFCFTANAQIITIKDSETLKPLELVTLNSNSPKAHAITNAHGQADISNLIGASEIEIRIIGYKTLVKSYRQLLENDKVVFLTSTPFSLYSVVVSANKWNQAKSEVSLKITTFSPEKVQLYNPQTAADLLGATGEVYIQKSQQGGGSPMMRGFATNRLLTMVDGIRMNTAIFRSGNIQNVISLDPFAIENTEVLFGPGSVIYGSDAIGGVMGFETLAPSLSVTEKPLVTGSALTRYSSANEENTYHFDVNVGWGKWASVTSFSNFNYGDLRMGTNGPKEYLRREYVGTIDGEDKVIANSDPLVQKPTGYSQTNLMQKLKFQPNENLDFTYGFHYSATTDYDRYDRHTRYKNGLPRSAEWYYGPQIWEMNNLTVNHFRKTALYEKATTRFAHQFFKESRIDRNYNSPERSIRIEKVHATSLNLDLLKSFDNHNQLFYGIEAVYDDVKSIGRDENLLTSTTVNGPSRYPKSTWASYAVYANYQFKTTDKLTFTAGTRYNQYILDADFDTTFYPFPYTMAKINDGALTGSFGLAYSPSNTLVFNLNLSTGFRSPNVDDLGKVFDSEPGSVVVPNPDLEAEYAYNIEAGISKVIHNFIKMDITGYYTILDNALVRRDFTLSGQDSILYDGEMSKVQAIQNAAEARVWGIQFGMDISTKPGFGFSTRSSFQDGKEELDDGSTSPLRHAAPWFGSSHVTYKNQDVTLDLYSLYSGEVSFRNMPESEKEKDYMYAIDEEGNPYSPGWITLNFKVLCPVNETFSVSAGLENITDERYRPYSSGIAAPGRNFVISVKAKY